MNTPPTKTQVIPKKSLGQNFLRDENIVRNIVQAADVCASDIVFEIGPGTGALTQHLVRAAKHVVAIELDQTMIPVLKANVRQTNLTIVHADALETDYAALLKDQSATPNTPVKFVANLPYYITSAAIRKILECGLRTQCVVLTIQKEVAERVVATPDDMSLLALSVQYYGTPTYIQTIPPSAFYPQPKVHSAVIKIVPYANASFDRKDTDAFFRMAKAGFAMPRKQLRNNLHSGLGLPKTDADVLLLKCDINPARRPETLTVEEWKALAAAWQARDKT